MSLRVRSSWRPATSTAMENWTSPLACQEPAMWFASCSATAMPPFNPPPFTRLARHRSEEHTSELQSLRHLVCRLLLEKKKTEDKAKTRHDYQRLRPALDRTRNRL